MEKVYAMHIEWSKPQLIQDVIDNLNGELGLYYITREYNGVEHSLYLGKSSADIKNRLTSHNDGWLREYYRNKIYVRIGKITYPKNITSDMIDDAESALIYEHGLSDFGTKILIENSSKIKSYSYTNLYRIRNNGDIFQLRPIVDMSCHPEY
ncbi:MAG: hypothetical protein ACI4RR_04960 [Eubacterium sp.]